MEHRDSAKLGQTLEEIDGRVVATIPGRSADYEWKLTPGSSALLWTDSDYEVLENCQEIRFQDIAVSIDLNGQITTTRLEPETEGAVGVSGNSQSDTSAEQPSDVQQVLAADNSDPEAEIPAPVFDHTDTGGGGGDGEGEDGRDDATITALQEGATRISLANYLPANTVETPVVSKAWAAHGQVELLPDGDLSYIPDETNTARDNITFIVHDGHWSTQVMKIRIENQVPLQELGSQLIPNQFDGMDTHVSLDIGGYLSELLVDGNVAINVSGLPAGLQYNSSRMFIEGVLNSDGSDGQTHTVNVAITTAAGQVLSTQFKWVVQQEKAIEARDALTRAVPPISSQSDAAAAAVLYSVASQASIAARGFSLSSQSATSQGSTATNPSQLDLARVGQIAGEGGQNTATGNEADNLFDLSINTPASEEEEGDESDLQLDDTSPVVNLRAGGIGGPAKAAPKQSVDLDQEGIVDIGTSPPQASNEAPFAGTPTAVVTPEDVGITGIDVLAAAYDPEGDALSISAASAGNGTVSISSSGQLDYTPNPDFNGADVISYTINDGNGNSSFGAVTVNVTPVNDDPVAGAVAPVITAEDTTLANIDVLSAASDIDGDTLSVISASAANGSVAINPDGSLNYTPNADYVGPDTVTYTISDGNGGTDTGTYDVTVSPVNDAPRPLADSGVVVEDSTVVIDILANDTDIDGTLDPASVQITGTPSAGDSLVVPGQGTWSVNTTTGEISFAPIADYDGVVSDISYTVADDLGDRSTPVNVSVTITPTNDAPIATADSDTVLEDGSVTIDVLANDSDIDGILDPASVQIIGTSAPGDSLIVAGEGTWSVNTATGEISFTPEADYDGPVTDISYQMRDDVGALSNPATISVTITPVNDAPVASADSDSVNEDGSVVINILANDTDIDGTLDPASVQITGTASAGDSLVVAGQGTWSVNTTTGAIAFTPEPDYNGPVTDITYTVRDNDGAVSSPATVSVSIIDVNDAPIGTDDSDVVAEDGSVIIDVLANDSDIDGTIDPTTVQITGTSAPGDPLVVAGEGSWTVNPTTGAITFTPEADYDGVVTDITYTVLDDDGAPTGPTTVSVTISGSNDDPVAAAIPDSGTNEDTNLNNIDVLSYVTDVDGDTVTVTGASAANGSVTVNGDGTLNYIPNANYNGTDTITFNLDDGNGGTSVGSLDVIVAPVNDDPDAGSPPLSTGIEDTTLSNIDVLSYASDIDGDVLSVSTASAGNGTVTINPDGTLNYVPDADYNGLDTISYTVDDGNGGTAAGTKFIFVNAVNDPPVANNDSDSVAEDSSVVINVLGNDTDVDGSLVPATVQITGTASAGDPLVMPGEGTWTVNTTTGEITFTPEADYNGPVTDITYTVQDNSGAVSSPATVSVTISAVNDAPVVDLSDVENIVVNGTFSDGISPNWTGWTESGIFDGAGAGANAPAMTQHGTGAIASVTQTGLSGLAAGPGDNGAALVKFDFGWSDHNHESESIQLTLTVAGVDYAQITTSSGVGTTTSVVYLNGATGPATVLTSSPEHDWTYQTVEVNLPASVSNSGDLTFSLQNMNTGGDHTDEASIDNVQVIVDTSNPGDTDNHLNYTAGDPPVDLLDLSSSINDQDGTLLQSARIQLTNAEVGDRLLVDGNIAGNGSSGTVNGLAWSSSISGVTVTIDIIGAATHADYLTALSLLQFENTAGSPTASVRSIDITVNDGIDDSAIAQALVFFGVDPTPPALTDDSANGFEDVPLVIDVLANDSSGGAAIDPTTVQLQDTANAGDPLVVPGEGTWTINPVTGEITFTGEAEYSGIPTPIHYSVSDVNGLRSMLADVNVTIVAVNDPPVATIDSDSVTEDGAVTIDVLINDSDIDGTLVPATVQIVGTSNPGDPLVVAGQGTWTVNPVNGEITFTPEPDYDGPVTDITYTVQDDGGATSNPASVSVTISPVNDAPVAAADSDTVVEDSSVIIDVLANDNDIDGGLMPATVQIVGTSNPGDPLAVPGEGTWTVNLLNGEITFTPEADYTGPVTDISYIVEDNNGTASNPATVSVSISATNDAPVLDLSDYDNAVSNSSFSAGSVGSWTDWVAAGPFASGGVAPNAPAVNFDSVGSTSTLTQSGVTGLSDGPGTNGTAVIQFDLGWNDVPSDGGRSQQLTLSVDGIDYVSLTTPSGPGTTATVNFLNGASGTPASISSSTYLDWTYSTIELNLPAGVSDTADVQFTWENLAGPQAATDDISIDNVKVIVNDLNPNDTDYQVDYQNGNDPISLLDSSASILDSDDTTLQSARILLTFAESGDAFLVGGVPASNGASGTVGGLAWSSTISGGQIEINLTGVGTHATYLAALQQIQFESNSATPVSSTRIVDITVNDGTADSVAAQTFILFDINDAPPDSVNDTAAGFEDTPLVIDVLANDINGDFPIDPTTVHIRGTTNPGDSLVVAGEGTWSVNGSTGEITFTPIAEYSGTPTPIEYTVSDVGGLGSKLAQVSATIAAVNDPPVASSDSDSVTEDGAVIIDVLSNDSDIDGTLVPATVQIVGTSNPGDPLVVAGQGTWSVNPINGEITFTPEPDYDGPVADITYTVQDDGGATSNPAAVSVTITPTNDAPVAVADSDTVFEDSSVIIDVLANDNDIDGTLVPATVQIVGTTNPGDPLAVPGEGTWTVNLATGEITFTPETDYNGPVTNIAYTVNDNSGATSAPTTVSVTITATNDAPVAANDASSGPINTTQTIVVLANDNDIDGDPLQVTSAFALNGSVGVNPDNTLSYTPNLNYFGSDTITYTISDGAGGSDAATVSVTIGGSNMPPMVDLDSTDNTPDQTFADDIETGTYSGSTGSAAWTSNWTEIGEADGPSNGSVRIVNDGGDDALRLTGRAVERELDLSSADTAQLSFDLRRTGDWDEDGRFSVEVSTDGISYTRIYTTTSGGSSYQTIDLNLTPYLSATTYIRFDLNRDENETAFIDDIIVTATYPDPTPYSGSFTEGAGPVAISDLANVSDIDSPNLQSATITIASPQAGDVLSVSGALPPGIVAGVYNPVTGTITLTGTASAAAYQAAIDLIRYENTSDDPATTDRIIGVRVNDGTANSNVATATISINAVNDPPVANSDGDTVLEDSFVAISVLSNDTDVDGTLDPATIQIAGTASAGDPLVVVGEGTWSINTISGEITFTPEADYNGPVTSITYTVRDDQGALSNPTTVSMSITPDNDAPTAITPAGNTGTSINTDGGNAGYFMAADGGALLGGLSTATVEAQFSIETPLVDGESAPLFNYHSGSSDQLELTFVYDTGTSPTPFIALEIAGSQVNITSWDASEMMDGGQHTLAMTWDNGAGNWELFLDGTSVASGSGLAATQTIAGGGFLVFGQEQDSPDGGYLPSEVFKGTYNDIRVFDDIRTPGEIAAGANATLPSSTPNLIANWLFDDGETTSVIDVVGGNDLSLTQVVGAGFTSSTPADVISVLDDSGAGTVVATLSTTDIDVGDTFTYALTSDPSGLFEIVGNQLRIASGSSVDYESATSHTVTVEVTDSGLATFSRDITIEVTNVPEINTGTAIFSDNTNQPLMSDWDGTSFASNVTGPNLGNEFRTMQVAEAPTRDEIIVVGVNTSSEVRAMMWDGSTWAEVSLGLLGAVSEDRWWGAEIAYEQSSGDAVMVWNDDGQSSGQQLRYATWDGSSWSSVQSVPGWIGDEPQHMKLSFDPGSDEMVLIVSDKNADDYAFVWDGSSWGNRVTLDTTGGGDPDRYSISVSHEADSGDAIVTYGKNGSDDIFYRVWDGVSWGTESSISAPVSATGDPVWIVSANDLSSDHIMVGAMTSGDEAWVSVWDGTSWETAFQIESSIESRDSPNIAVAFENQSGQGLVTYSRSSTDTVYYRTWDSVGGWSAEQTLADFGDKINSMTLDSSPNSDQIMLSVQDDGHDLNYVLWDGNNWGTPVQLEDDTGENRHQPFAFVWDQDGVLTTSPLAFDLNRDGEINVTGETTAQNKAGIRELGATVQFDTDGDGDLETIEWLDGSGDALLVNNVDGNAASDMNGTRLFGDQDGAYEHGYQQLAEFDTNSDGVISGDEGNGLNLWIDDGNAKVDEGELFTLSEMGISEIELALEEHAVDEDGRDLFRSSATLNDGTKILTEDVWFGQALSEEEDPVTPPEQSTVPQPDDLLG